MNTPKNMISIGAAVLAAGEGKRMLHPEPKPLVPVFSGPSASRLIDFPLQAIEQAFKQFQLKKGIVVGHERERVEGYLKTRYPDAQFAFQSERLGTADALRAYYRDVPWAKGQDYTLVVIADTPLLTAQLFTEMMAEMQGDPALDGVVAAFELKEPKGYGRVICGPKLGLKIIEEKDASPQEKSIKLVNAAIYLLKTSFVLEHLPKIKNDNKSGEFYLTDLFTMDAKIKAINFPDADLFRGVNDLKQLGEARQFLKSRIIDEWESKGVLFLDKASTHLDDQVKLEPLVTLHPNVHLEGQTSVQSGSVIEPGSIIKNCKIGKGVKIKAYSYMENSTVEAQAQVGPFAHLRPDSHLGPEVKVGNFVEVKKSRLAKGAKVSHLSYVGDAEIGEESNIGCGFITCNYDGANKHRTTIGARTFIGSDCQIIAPLSIGDDCFVAAGSTVTQDLASGDFALARTKQVTKPGMAKKFLKSKKAT